ncbi:hypothetical protein BDY19DRAFT_892908 [Irpex rosettiformis]|uniref:Uncharacterized protein n=1 Tax=Irpex rosettiformis TaxID=378272 RepID=A0ACB8U0K2_9APHY|nr:hypothetical protein BDY19DRAFT_892908 [Irpex rosettiformis]
MLHFPPARVATGILLSIFQIIQDLQSNRDECYRLARRCLKLLTDLRDAMSGHWEDSPESLLKSITKFEGVLQTIHDDLKKEAEQKWHSRLMRKNTIQTALGEYNVLVDDAARSFQITTLIHLHHAIGRTAASSSRSTPAVIQGTLPATDVSDIFSDRSVICDTPVSDYIAWFTYTDYIPQSSITFSDRDLVSYPPSERPSSSDFSILESSTIEMAVPAAIIFEKAGEDVARKIDILDDKGFRRYHQSEITVTGSSKIRSGWWAGGQDVQLNGRRLMMLPYDGPYNQAAKRWLRDVKALQNVHHPNLPQMVGYSGTDTPTPFILLANVQTRLPQARVQDAIKNASLLDCARLLIRFYKDVFDAAIYMQRQLSLTDSKIQDYVEYSSFRIEGYDSMIMGLPPPEVHNMISYRNFGLAHSIRDIFIQASCKNTSAYAVCDSVSRELQMKINHLGLLVRSIFPSGDDSFHEATTRLDELLVDDDNEEAEPLTLPMIRMAAIRARTHGQSWANNFCQAHQFAVGDIGYVPNGDRKIECERERWKDFVRIGNVLQDGIVELEVTEHATGRKMRFEHGRFDREELQPFELPGGVYGWPLVMEAGTRQNVQVVHERVIRYVSDAWKTLLSYAPRLAEQHGVKPQDLILITCAGIDQRFIMHDTRHVPPPHPSSYFHNHQMHGHRPHFQSPFGGIHPHHQHQFHLPSAPGFGPPPPAIFYAFTSIAEEFGMTVSDSPVYLPPVLQARRPPMPKQCVWGAEGVHGFINYVQLHEEDFR